VALRHRDGRQEILDYAEAAARLAAAAARPTA
jgi:hypothetical protein